MNYKKLMIVVEAILTFGAVAFVSCDKEKDVDKRNVEFLGGKSGAPINFRQLHNDMLAYVIDNFDETIEFNDVYEIVNYVRDIDMTYIDKNGFDEETGNILREMCEITKECVSTPDLYDSMFAGQYSFKNSINILYKAKLIEDFDRDILMSIYGQIVKAYNQEASNDEVVGNIKSQAELGQKKTNSMVADAIYSIALSSICFWEENGEGYMPVDPETPVCYMPPQVGADVVGAAYSAAVATAGQLIVNGKVNGKTVAIAAVGGAVNSSFGVAAKAANAVVKAAKAAGKFIHKLIK